MSKELTPEEMAAFQARMVEVATRLFAERGVEAVSLRGIAAEAGISRSTPYRYFRDKRHLIDAVRTAALGRLTDRVTAAIALGANPLERLRAAGDAYCDFALAEPNAYSLLFSTPSGAEEDPDFLKAVAAYRAVAEAPLREAIAQGLILGDPDEIGHVFWASLHGLVTLHLSGRLRLGVDFQQLRQALSQALAFGLFAPELRPGGPSGR